MVRNEIRDGRRVAELLASEVDALGTGALAGLSVADADRGAEPSPEGTFAYAIERDGERIATVSIYPERAQVTVLGGVDAAATAATEVGLSAERTADCVAVRVESGAAVKRVLSALAAAAREMGTL